MFKLLSSLKSKASLIFTLKNVTQILSIQKVNFLVFQAGRQDVFTLQFLEIRFQCHIRSSLRYYFEGCQASYLSSQKFSRWFQNFILSNLKIVLISEECVLKKKKSEEKCFSIDSFLHKLYLRLSVTRGCVSLVNKLNTIANNLFNLL